MLKNLILISAGILLGFGVFYLFGPDQDYELEMKQDHEQLYTCGMHPEVLVNEPGNCPICEMKLIPVKNESTGSAGEKKILYWQAPMDPTEIYEQPGKSKMGMDLVPVYEETGSGSGIIKIDGRVRQNMNLRTSEVSHRALKRSIRAYGRVTVAEDYQYTVTTKIKGWIEKLYFNTTGQYIKKGQALLEIYSPELVSTQEEFLLAHRNLQQMGNSKSVAAENARSLYESAKRRLELWDISEREIDLLKETGQVKRTTVMRSPVNGYLMHKAVVEGDEVGKNLPHLFMIADLSKVWVEATVYESELSFLSVGQTANLNLDFINNEVFKGEVDFIYPYLDPKTRAANVRLTFNNPNLILKPDMHVTVNIVSNISDNALAIPQEAVIRTGVRNVVFVELNDGQFEAREVQLGAESDDGFVQILGGTLLGDKVVTSGQFLLDSESQTREAIQKMRAAKSNEPGAMKMEKEKDDMATPKKKSKMDSEMKCGEGKCGDSMKKAEPEKKEPEMKCGEGKCGGDK